MTTFWNLFYNSESVLWARLQIFLGSIVAVLMATDVSPWIPKEYLPIWVIFNGIVGEYLRRRKTQTATIAVEDKKGEVTQVTYLKAPNPVPEGTVKIAEVSTK